MRPATTRLAAQIDHALAQAECAGMSAVRDACIAAVEAEIDRMQALSNEADRNYVTDSANETSVERLERIGLIWSLSSGRRILSLIRGLDIRMPEGGAS